ncbi:hypothetical protein BN2537_16897 [Streptomyces venezuelae]|nr:hypothetical protein BN2537_16897 [Streptomyces venezuelae]
MLAGEPLQLPEQGCLSDASAAPNVEEEALRRVLGLQGEVSAVRVEFGPRPRNLPLLDAGSAHTSTVSGCAVQRS